MWLVYRPLKVMQAEFKWPLGVSYTQAHDFERISEAWMEQSRALNSVHTTKGATASQLWNRNMQLWFVMEN